MLKLSLIAMMLFSAAANAGTSVPARSGYIAPGINSANNFAVGSSIGGTLVGQSFAANRITNLTAIPGRANVFSGYVNNQKYIFNYVGGSYIASVISQ